MAKVDKPHNGGQWSEARKTSFIKSALRGARWGPKYEAVKLAYVKKGINPKTGRPCKLHRCQECAGLFPQKEVRADHAIPVVGPEGFVDWNTFIERLYVEREGYIILCISCHKGVTDRENNERRQRKARDKQRRSEQDSPTLHL